MGKNKLKKFADMRGFKCVLQYPREELLKAGFPYRNKWNTDFFATERPITLELGCGRGEYTVALARQYGDRNFIGIDIKGARMWTGAKEVEEDNLDNAAFLRTEIEQIDSFFSEGEVDEIWITFPDPQMQKPRKRLTSPRFLELYRKILKPGGIINLKTDSPFLYEYTRRLIEVNQLPLLTDIPDLYQDEAEASAPDHDSDTDIYRTIQTYYERQWLSRGKTIKLLRFRLPSEITLIEPPSDDIPRDDYRSVGGRSNIIQ